MSDDLIAFLKAWHDWATNGAPDGEPFSREDGLCDNVWNWDVVGSPPRNRAYDALNKMFDHCMFPFGADDYGAGWRDSTQHECPKRLAWVREKLVEAGELVA